MDNAFWNGFAMFYGSGNTLFTSPLAKSLDVAGHEISHGVIQNTANLTYQGQSGALNESFADVFGVLIDPAGQTRTLDPDRIGFEVIKKSRVAGRLIPTRWRIDLPEIDRGIVKLKRLDPLLHARIAHGVF